MDILPINIINKLSLVRQLLLGVCIYSIMEKIYIVFGGASVEHDVSIVTALQTYNAIKEVYKVGLIYLDTNNKMYLSDKTTTNEYIDKEKLLKDLKQICIVDKKIYQVRKNKLKFLCNIDCVINCCHGGIGENGGLKALLDINNIASTSAGAIASGVCMNKVYTKLVAELLDIPVVEYIVAKKFDKQLVDKVSTFGERLIVKPCNLGSSIGVVKSNIESLQEDIETVLHLDSEGLIEREISPLIEYNCAIIKDGSGVIVSQIEQPINNSEILTFEDKYINSEKTHIIPANLDESVQNRIYEYTKKIYSYLGLNGVVRIDYLYNEKDDIVYLNEINTIPGSLAYYLFEGIGISYIKLIDILIKNASINKLQPYFATNILTNLKNIGK